jgi:hypothetical protein
MYATGQTGDDAGSTPKETKFQQWLKAYGAQKLADEMSARGEPVTFSAVYQWGRRLHEPRGPKQRLIVKLSRGALKLQDIADHFGSP